QNRHRSCIPNENVVLAQIALNGSNDLASANRRYIAVATVGGVAKEIANPRFDFDSREHIGGCGVIHQFANMLIAKHRLAEFAQPETGCHPSRRDDHRKKSWLKFLRLLYEVLIDRHI